MYLRTSQCSKPEYAIMSPLIESKVMTNTGLVRLTAVMRTKCLNRLSEIPILTKHDAHERTPLLYVTIPVGVSQMGQTASSEGPNHMLKIYSRTFETATISDDFDELFLRGYGDSDDAETSIPDNSVVDVGSQVLEDDDYPIEAIHANLYPQTNMLAESGDTNRQNVPHKSGESKRLMSESYSSSKSMLDSRYKFLIMSPSDCVMWQENLRRCYNHESDLLNCDEQVGAYAKCAREAVNARLA